MQKQSENTEEQGVGDTAQYSGMRRQFLRLVFVIAILAIPFLVAGPWMEEVVTDWYREKSGSGDHLLVVLAAIVLLASDILIPVPASVVCTILGAAFGFTAGTIAGASGLTLASFLGYWIGRLFAHRDLSTIKVNQSAFARHSWFLALTRPVPLAGEAAMIVAGASGVSMIRVMAIVVPANVVIAASWSGMGAWGNQNGLGGEAIAFAAVLPVAAGALMFSRKKLGGISRDIETRK